MNAELDATIGPILQIYADRARRHPVGVRRRRARRPDEPLPLGRRASASSRASSATSRASRIRTGTRRPRRGFAEKWGQNPAMVTSFADGSKISFEQAIVANATGFVVQSRGMSRGLEYRDDVMKIGELYDIDELRELGGHHRLRRRHAPDEGLLPRRASRPEAAALPRTSTRWATGRCTRSSSRTTSCTSRCRTRSPAWCCFRDSRRQAARRPGRRGVRGREARPQGGRDARRLRHVHDLRRGGQRRRDERPALPAGGPRRGLPLARDIAAGRRDHLRRRRCSRRIGSPTGCAPSSTGSSAARPGSRSCSRFPSEPAESSATNRGGRSAEVRRLSDRACR